MIPKIVQVFLDSLFPFVAPLVLGLVALPFALPYAVFSCMRHARSQWQFESGSAGYCNSKAKSQSNGEVVFITGTAGGVGNLLVRRIISSMQPAAVIAVDIVPHAFPNLPSVYTYVCDISDPVAVAALAKTVKATHGHPTVLINNAAVVPGKSLLELSDVEIARTISVNLVSNFFTLRAFLPHMKIVNSGKIINVASLLGHVTANNLTDYCASKFGVVGLTSALVSELAGTNIHVSLVSPGYIQTNLFKGFSYRFAWLTPALSTSDVVDAIINCVDSNVSNLNVFLPFFARFAPYLRALPCDIQHLLRSLLGANDSMRNFVGRAPNFDTAKTSVNTYKAPTSTRQRVKVME